MTSLPGGIVLPADAVSCAAGLIKIFFKTLSFPPSSYVMEVWTLARQPGSAPSL
jgi:hypothetical protein